MVQKGKYKDQPLPLEQREDTQGRGPGAEIKTLTQRAQPWLTERQRSPREATRVALARNSLFGCQGKLFVGR